MKSLVSDKKERKRKQRRNQIVIATILLALMFLSIAGYSFQSRGSDDASKENIISYNGRNFYLQNGFWITDLSGSFFAFKTDPRNFPEINSTINKISSYYGEIIYLNAELSEGLNSIYRNILPFSSRYQEACIENRTDLICDEVWPTKDCSKDTIIIIKNLEVQNVSQQGKCLFIEGPEENITKIVDSVVAEIVGI